MFEAKNQIQSILEMMVERDRLILTVRDTQETEKSLKKLNRLAISIQS